ncbi:MAG: hypothetical protein JXL80_15980 [Planctomycetes bacterium]|nr:hypothetical protein [Planctomycetota bacterium]
MSTIENLRAMRQAAGPVLEGLLAYYDNRIVRDGKRAWLPYGSLPAMARLPVSSDTPPSSRLTCDVALGYLVSHLETGSDKHLETGLAMLRHAFARQAPQGHFVWNYGQHEIDQVDLGTVLDTYYWFWTQVSELPQDVRRGIEASTRRAIDYLKTMEQPAYPGIIQKRAGDPEHPEDRRTADYQKIDVLNGNALAVTAYCRAATILGQPELADRAATFERNMVESFGRHVPGWWIYIEWLGSREVHTAETILYQAMTALYLEPLYRARPTEALRGMLAESLRTLDDITDEHGNLDWSRESRKDFEDTQLLMLPSAAAALCDVYDLTTAGRRRMDLVARTMVDGETGLLRDAVGHRRHGELADELRQIWGTSDLALIILYGRRADDAASA